MKRRPAQPVELAAARATEQEALEAFALAEVEAGEALTGVHPPDDATRARCAAWRRKRAKR